MSAELLTEHHLEFLDLTGCCTCSSDLSKCHTVGNQVPRLNLYPMLICSNMEPIVELVFCFNIVLRNTCLHLNSGTINAGVSDDTSLCFCFLHNKTHQSVVYFFLHNETSVQNILTHFGH